MIDVPAGNVAGILRAAAHEWPRQPALAVGDHVICDYAGLGTRAACLARAFAVAGLRDGDRIAIVARNAPEYVEVLFGSWWAGLVAVPVNARLNPRELGYILADSGARWAFVDAQWQAALATVDAKALERIVTLGGREYASLAAAPMQPEAAIRARHDPAWLFYTSGTTGRPKGVVITHGNLLAMCQAFRADVEQVDPGDALLHVAPLSHGSGLYVLPHVMGGAVNVIPASGGFDADETAGLVDIWNRATFFAAPTMVKRLLAARTLGKMNLLHLKSIVYGGGPMYVADCKAAHAVLGPRLAQIYGQGESPMTITAMNRRDLAAAVARGDDARIGSVGRAQSGIELRVADARDGPLPAGAEGEVLVRGPTVMAGYWRNPEASAAALANGWLHTGDIGVLDADGYLTLKDRSKDLIISGGANIYPREVEEVLQAHPGVAEVAVIGRPHPDWGEEVLACIVMRRDDGDPHARVRLEHELDELCLERIARFKRPKAYVFVAALPKNNAGKVLKTALREQFAPDN